MDKLNSSQTRWRDEHEEGPKLLNEPRGGNQEPGDHHQRLRPRPRHFSGGAVLLAAQTRVAGGV